MFDIGYTVAFVAGMVSFFAPCVVSLLPAYVGYVTGATMSELKRKSKTTYTRQIFISSILYVLGFSLIFVLLGSAAASVGFIFRKYDFLIQRIGGFVILVLGLEFAGIVNFTFLARQRQFGLPAWTNKFKYGRAFLIGVIFATAWTPCVGPILGSILALAAVEATATKGALLLLTYSLGISLPFLFIAATLASAPRYISLVSKHVRFISVAAGLMLVVVGLLLITDTYKYVNAWIFEVASKLGYEVR